MPLYYFKITIKADPEPKVITGYRFNDSSNIDYVYKVAKEATFNKYRGALIEIDCWMCHRVSKQYKDWFKAYRRLHPWYPDPGSFGMDIDPLEPEEWHLPNESKKEQYSRESRDRPSRGEMIKKEREDEERRKREG